MFTDLGESLYRSAPHVLAKFSSHEPRNRNEHSRRNPNPLELTQQDAQAAAGEKRIDTDRRDLNWAPGKEVTIIGERRKESYTESAVSECVEHGV